MRGERTFSISEKFWVRAIAVLSTVHVHLYTYRRTQYLQLIPKKTNSNPKINMKKLNSILSSKEHLQTWVNYWGGLSNLALTNSYFELNWLKIKFSLNHFALQKVHRENISILVQNNLYDLISVLHNQIASLLLN